MSALHSFHTRHDSLDGLVCEAHQLGVNLSVCQLDTARGESAMSLLASASTTVTAYAVGNRTHHHLGGQADCHTFGLLSRDQKSSQILNRPFTFGDMLHVDADCGLDAVTEAGFAGYTVAISRERLRQIAELIECDAYDDEMADAGLERPMPAAIARELRRRLQCLVSAQPAGVSDSAELFLESGLPALVLSAWTGGERLKTGTLALSARRKTLRRAVDYIHANAGGRCTVEQVCLASSASYSTLERAFRESFGISPIRYISQLRLSGVRRALMVGRGERSITDIAHEWGFNHMGKVAADYRRQFGELPSCTVRASYAFARDRRRPPQKADQG